MSSIYGYLNGWVSLISKFATFLPTWCYHCQSYISSAGTSPCPSLCLSCFKGLPTPFETICRHCGLPHTTVKCDQKWARQIKSFDYIFPYTEPIRHWVTSLKYSRNLIAGRALRELINLWISENSSKFETVDFLLPIPISRGRLRDRGFNQTTYLLNSQTVLKSDPSIIKKIRDTPQQAGLSKVQRSKAREESFSVIKNIKDKNILIFDDVCTTGQTIKAVSNLLRKAGAGEIRVLVLCRAFGS